MDVPLCRFYAYSDHFERDSFQTSFSFSYGLYTTCLCNCTENWSEPVILSAKIRHA